MLKSFFQYPLLGGRVFSANIVASSVDLIHMRQDRSPAHHDSVADAGSTLKGVTPDHLFQANLSTAQFGKRYPGDNYFKKVYKKSLRHDD